MVPDTVLTGAGEEASTENGMPTRDITSNTNSTKGLREHPFGHPSRLKAKRRMLTYFA